MINRPLGLLVSMVFFALANPASAWEIRLDSCLIGGTFQIVSVNTGFPKASCSYTFTDTDGVALNGKLSVNGNLGLLYSKAQGSHQALADAGTLNEVLHVRGTWAHQIIPVTVTMHFVGQVSGFLKPTGTNGGQQTHLGMVSLAGSGVENTARFDADIEAGAIHPLPNDNSSGNFSVVINSQTQTSIDVTLSATASMDKLHPDLSVQLVVFGSGDTPFSGKRETSISQGSVSIELPEGFSYKSQSHHFLGN